MSGLLRDSQQAILAQALEDLNIVDPDIWPINVDQDSESPDTSITVYGTLGRDDGRTQIDGELQEHHGVQIKVSSLDRTGFLIATQLAVACDGMVDKGVTVSSELMGTNYYILQSVNRTGNGVNALGKDMVNTRRNLYTFNALVNVRMVTPPTQS